MNAPQTQLDITFEDGSGLLAWYAELLGAGTVALPTSGEALELEQRVHVRVGVRETVPLELQGEVIRAEEGVNRLSVQVTRALKERVYYLAMAQRGGRLSSGAGQHRKHARFSTLLNVRFRSVPALLDAMATNISEGGLFVRSDASPPLGAIVELSVQFPDGTFRPVKGEVVRVVTPEEASATKGVPGIGIHFLEESSEFHDATGKLLDEYVRRPRRVLLVDDDFFFLRVLGDALLAAGFEVATAQGGREASRKLVELLYELDAVVLDLQMPGVDGHVLLERIRRLGSEMPLKLVVVSGTHQELLNPLVGAGGADAAFSKSLGIDTLVVRLREALD